MNVLQLIRFDSETGAPYLDTIQQALEIEEDEVLKQADELQAVRSTPGYKILEDHMLQSIEAAKDKLLDAKDLDEIRRYQSLAAAFSNLLGVVDTVIREAANIRQEIQSQERE